MKVSEKKVCINWLYNDYVRAGESLDLAVILTSPAIVRTAGLRARR